MPAILFPDINPIAISIGPIDIRWYSLAYFFGIIFGFMLLKFQVKRFKFEIEANELEDIVFYSVLGIVFGGRIGYMALYQFHTLLNNPLELFYVWEGGMSFHGGVIGFAIAIYLFTKRYKVDFLKLMDHIVCVVPLGIFLGRIANFINGELFGRVTNAPWGVIFPNGGILPRHPSQIYEAFSEGLLCFLIMQIVLYTTSSIEKKGRMTALFLILYSISRMICELFREPDAHIGFLVNYLTMGQILSAPLLIVGLVIWKKSRN
jgi:phosphatidylglycerol:prolipoprotein diacylglycerol transferase